MNKNNSTVLENHHSSKWIHVDDGVWIIYKHGVGSNELLVEMDVISMRK